MRRTRRDFLRTIGAATLAVARQPVDFAGTAPGQRRTIAGILFAWCPPGRFLMGSPLNEPGRRADEAQVTVTLTHGFWMSVHEVTQGQWRKHVGAAPGRPLTPAFGLGDDYPVYWVSFHDAERFCGRLTADSHRDGQLPSTWAVRIPTEAQWEYACRAGTTTAAAFGAMLTSATANFDHEAVPTSRRPVSTRGSSPVGRYPANPWGLHDMHGNIFEWCRDWYHARLPGGVDPDLSSTPGVRNGDGSYSRCRRGGAWNDPAAYCRSASRWRYEPERSSDHIGFRVLVEPA